MRFYARNFVLLIALGLVSIAAWFYFTSLLSESSSPDASSRPTHSPQETSTGTSSAQLAERARPPNSGELSQSGKVQNIICRINGEKDVNCLKLLSGKESTVYVPFSFIHKYFEVSGKLVRSKNEEHLEWSHTNAKIYYPDQPYNFASKYLWFENYNVETRSRVKCISAIESVPISTQWYSKGHFYPIQIAQYGLSHFSKNISEPLPKRIALISEGLLSGMVSNSSLTLVKNGNYFRCSNSSLLHLHTELTYPIFEVDLRLHSASSIAFHMTDSTGQQLSVQYATSNSQLDVITVNNQVIKYGISNRLIGSGLFTMSRDLLVDLSKANLITNRKRATNYRLVRIEVTGQVDIRSIFLCSSAHDRFSKAAADWFVRNQNTLGGWNIKVRRRLEKSSGGPLILKEGWHSAMAQGQAMSLLTRIYSVTSEAKYLEAAKKALAIFEVEYFKNGIKAMLFDKYVWYEEYPTVPSIYVLNGFIYSLFGLYDLSKMCEDSACRKAAQLFDDGIRSLEALLPMFDSGLGSFYDLRHLSLTSPPNVARWDYHATHVNQLLFLNSVVRRDVFQVTLDRWIGYMMGHRAPHN